MLEKIKKIARGDKKFPNCLKKVRPKIKELYYRGKFPKENEPCFAVVGARNCSGYGKQATLQIAGELADAGFTIVSGMAPGIDTAAHIAAVERKKRTVAVLGSSLDKESVYPQENLGLAEKILENNGCLISEYPEGTKGTYYTFPQRNRIVSGLSLGALVVEAKEKSGSLITADLALSQKKMLFSVPGPIYSLNSRGTNGLLKKGAKLVDSAQDILKELGSYVKYTEFDRRERTDTMGVENQEEKIILDALRKEALLIDKIIEKTNLSPSVVAIALVNMEIKGMVNNQGDGMYALSK